MGIDSGAAVTKVGKTDKKALRADIAQRLAAPGQPGHE
jgi:hypothetical protein